MFLHVYVAQTALAFMPAHGQVVASPAAGSGQRPIVDAAANGVPVVHIAPPTAAGVSRNQYQQFNVGTPGLVLDNSSSAVQTRSAGWISGNPQLGYVPARVIVTVNASSVDNTNGEMSASGNLLLDAPTLLNTNGLIAASNFLGVRTASQSLGGALSGRDIDLDIAGSFLNTGSLYASRDLSLSADSLVNSGLLGAGGLLSLQIRGDLSNTLTGEMSGAGVDVVVGGRFENRGLVNGTSSGARTSIVAASVDNTGRVYGEQVDVRADTIDNAATGVIAARSALNLAGGTLRNTGPDALLLSLGSLDIGGRFDTQLMQATGSATSFANSAGRVEALGNLSLSADTISNSNGGLRTQWVTVGVPVPTSYVIPAGSAIRYPLSQCSGITERLDQAGCIVHPELYGVRTVLASAFDQVATGSTEVVIRPHYAWTDPVYARFGVASMGQPPPAEPGGVGGCTVMTGDGASESTSPACSSWRGDTAAWNAAYAQVSANLQVAIDTYNEGVNEDNRLLLFEDYTLIEATAVTRRTQVTSSAPGQILSGGAMLLDGASITNTDSRIVAGGLLYVNGRGSVAGSAPIAAGVNNVSTPGQQTVTDTGNSQFTHLDSCHHGDKCRVYEAVQPWNTAATISTVDLDTTVYQQNANASLGGMATATAASGNARAPGAAYAVIGDLVAGGTAPIPTAQSEMVGVAVHAATSGRTSSGVITATALLDGGAAAPAADASARRLSTIPAVQRFHVNGSDQSARGVVLTVMPQLVLPTNQLFRLHAEPGARFLVETDPAFTGYKNFIGSDYFAQQLALDPLHTAKRYGDGFYEQSLVNDQIMALTGRRYLTGYQSTEDEFKALMDAGVAFARAFQLSPGVALSAEQMALLTTDIVWLTTQSVLLADGTRAEVLVPQVYIRQTRDGDLAPGGALMAGQTLIINTAADLANSGTLAGARVHVDAANIGNTGHITANEQVLLAARNDVSSLSGSISSGTGIVSLTAGRDVIVQTRTIESSRSTTTIDAAGATVGLGESSRTSVDRVATIQAGSDLIIDAGRDLRVQGASLSASGNIKATAARDISVEAVTGAWQLITHDVSGSTFDNRVGSTVIGATKQQGSEMKAGSDITLTAGTADIQAAPADGKLDVKGSSITAGKDLRLKGNSITVAAAKEGASLAIQTVQPRSFDHSFKSDQSLFGGQLAAGGNMSIVATGKGVPGQGDIELSGATLKAQGLVLLSANHDVRVLDATTYHEVAGESHLLDKGLLKRTDITSLSGTAVTNSTGSSISGSLTTIVAGNDIGVQGSHVAGTEGVWLSAGRNLAIEEARVTARTTTTDEEHASGMAGMFGGGPIPGSSGNKLSTTRSTEEVSASSISSANGTVRIEADGAAALQGVQIKAAKNIDIIGSTVSVIGATGNDTFNTEGSSHGTDVGITGFQKPGNGFKSKLTEGTQQASSSLTRSVLDATAVHIAANGADGSEGNLQIAGTTVNAASLSMQASGTLTLGVQITGQGSSQQKDGRDLVWQKHEDRGSVDTTANYNNFNVGTSSTSARKVVIELAQPPPVTTAGVTAAAPDLLQQIDQLASQPGMAWIGQLKTVAPGQPQPDWKAVELARNSWDDKQQGLTPEGALIVTVVVAWLTAGVAAKAASTFASAAAGSTATAAGAGAVTAAATAAYVTLATQASIALLNNQGNVAKALHDMGSSANVKALVASIATAGVLAGLSLPPPTTSTTSAPDAGSSAFMAQVQKNLTAGAARAVIDSAINGTSLQDNLERQLKGAVLDTLAAQGANEIGTAHLDDFANKVAHAIAGCAAGAANADNANGCSAGALGAAIGELSAEFYGRRASTVQFAALMSSVAAAVTGQDIDVAGAAGATVAANNFLKHDQAAAMKAEVTACTAKPKGCSDDEVMSLVGKYRAISNTNIAAVEACVLAGDAGCARALEAQAATASEVSGILPFGYASIEAQFLVRQNNALAGSVKGSLSETDEARARVIADYKTANCGPTVSVSDCGLKINAALAKGQLVMSGMAVVAVSGVLVPVATELLALTASGIATLASEAKLIVEMGAVNYCLFKPTVCATLTEAGMGAASGAVAPSALPPLAPKGLKAAIPSGFSPYTMEGLETGAIGVVDNATGEIRMLTASGLLKDIPPKPIPSNISVTYVLQSDTNMVYGKGIQAQGGAFEDFIATLMSWESRLPPNFRIFDFFVSKSGTAISVKTLDTMTESRLTNPRRVYTSLKENVDTVANFDKVIELSGVQLRPQDVLVRELYVGIPSGTSSAQWDQIANATAYAKGRGVNLKVYVVNP